MPTEPKTVTLLARTFELELPASWALRSEIVACGATNVQRAFGAALGACVPRLDRMLGTSYEKAGFSPLKYGGQVVDALVAKGVPVEQINEAGAAAFSLLADAFISEREVADTADFSSPKPEAPTSP